MLRKLIADHEPELIAAAFGRPGAPRSARSWPPTTRPTAPPMPADLAEQVPWVHDACEALGVPILTHSEYEADDVIGTLAERARAARIDVAIVTGDKDFYQLVREGIRVFNPRDEGDLVRRRRGCGTSSESRPSRSSTSSR